MTEQEKLLKFYVDPRAAIDLCMADFEPDQKMLKAEMANALYGPTGSLESTLDQVWEMIQRIQQRRPGSGFSQHEVVRRLPLAPLLELAGRLSWHTTRCFGDGASRLVDRSVTGEERCSFLLSLAGGLTVFGDNDKERPKSPQSSCASRAREVLEIWADWVINGDLIQEAAEQASNWIKQSPSCFGYALLVAIAERIEGGEFTRTSCPKSWEVLEKLSYAMHRLVLGYLPYRPVGVPSQQMRAITALAAIAEADEEAMAAHRS